MASRALKAAEVFGRKIGQEAFAIVKEVGKEVGKELGPQYIEQHIQKEYGSKTSEESKQALKFALKVFGTTKTVRGGPAQHMIGQHRTSIVKDAVSQVLYPLKPNADGVLASILKKPQPPFAEVHVAQKDCSVLQYLNHGDFYVCKKDESNPRTCTSIHGQAAGELETILEQHMDCITYTLPTHTRKCASRSARDLSHGYSIYNCADELQSPPKSPQKTPPKMQGGRRRHTRKGRGYRRKGTRKH